MASVRKRTLPSGAVRWMACYTDSGGNPRFKNFKKKKDAETYLHKTAVAVAAGEHVAPSQSITFKEAAWLWVKRAKDDGLRPSTIEQYESHVRNHLNPRIGALRLSDITKPTVARLIEELKSDTSINMAKKVKTSLTSILGYAHETGRVGQNVASGIKVTRGKANKKKVQPGADFPTKDQVQTIISNARGRWRPFIITAIFTGMRASELRGLQWPDVDLEGKAINVRRMADHLKGFNDPKSNAGSRAIPVGDFLLNTLRQWKDECPKSDYDLVFPAAAGGVVTYSVCLRSGLVPTLAACEFVTCENKDVLLSLKDDGWDGLKSNQKRQIRPLFGFHSLRHFYASWRLEQRYSIKQVQTWLGHENASMTLDLYGHLLSNEVDQGMITQQEIDLAGHSGETRPEQNPEKPFKIILPSQA